MMSSIDGLFNVDVKRLALLVVPTWLRRRLVGCLIYAGVAPLVRLVQELRDFRGRTCYRLRHNGQVCKLRGLLNDEFDPVCRRISVEDWDGEDEGVGCAVYCRDVGRWMVLGLRSGGVVIERRGYVGAGGYDFWVSVPADVMCEGVERRLRAVVNEYKLASRRFFINVKG